MKFQYYILFVLIALSSCSSVPPKEQSDSTSFMQADKLEQFLFASISIETENSGKSYILSCTNKKISSGKIKPSYIDDYKPLNGDIQIEILDANSNIIKTRYLANPLNETTEFVNQSGNLELAKFKSNKTYFFLRINLPVSAKFVVIRIFGTISPEQENLIINL